MSQFTTFKFARGKAVEVSKERADYLEKYRAVREFVFDRDRYMCQVCHKRGYHGSNHGEALKLTTHHIKPIHKGGAELDPNNQVAIHFSCHKEIQP